jgi:hypothetical protein
MKTFITLAKRAKKKFERPVPRRFLLRSYIQAAISGNQDLRDYLLTNIDE